MFSYFFKYVIAGLTRNPLTILNVCSLQLFLFAGKITNKFSHKKGVENTMSSTPCRLKYLLRKRNYLKFFNFRH